MPLKPFHFKQFIVAHDSSTHKVGTDAVLLGSWANIHESDKLFLDIGTGSGVIALMLAQRTKRGVHIDAIEIRRKDASQARRNVANSPWPEKITVHHTAAQTFVPGMHYDLIVSNPPYFEKSLLPPDHQRSAARHTHELSFTDLLECVSRLMSPQGKFSAILPYTEALRFKDMAEGIGLFVTRHTNFRSRGHKPIERVLLEFSRTQGTVQKTDLTLYADGGTWTEKYRRLTKDFYLGI